VDDVLGVARSYQQACVLLAAAELGVFDALAQGPRTAEELASDVRADVRAMGVLADALTVMKLLAKDRGRYTPAPGASAYLREAGGQSVLALLRHQANCLRNWAQLAAVVKTGRRAQSPPSIRGSRADLATFIEAMDEVSRPLVAELVAAVGPPEFRHLLDVGGGPGTWTIAFLRARPAAKATLFDRPEVIPIARRHLTEVGLEGRVTLVGGDFNVEKALPPGADLVWVSAIVHQNSRRENRQLFCKLHAALADDGLILIRDVVMEESGTQPPEGAMFAVNMLVNTESGGTYTFAELAGDLEEAGFRRPELLRRGCFMDSVVQARK